MADPTVKLPDSVNTRDGGVPPEEDPKPGLTTPGEDDEEDSDEAK